MLVRSRSHLPRLQTETSFATEGSVHGTVSDSTRADESFHLAPPSLHPMLATVTFTGDANVVDAKRAK